jgi:hypothetical protein
MARAKAGEPLGIGVIGCGTIANSAHLPAIRHLSDRLRLVAVADVREEQAARAAREFGAEAYYTDYRQLLARPDIAIVDICTPEFLHREQVVAAAEAGKHILCEKPMADSIEAADAMLAAAARGRQIDGRAQPPLHPALPRGARGDRSRRSRRGAAGARERAPPARDVQLAAARLGLLVADRQALG